MSDNEGPAEVGRARVRDAVEGRLAELPNGEMERAIKLIVAGAIAIAFEMTYLFGLWKGKEVVIDRLEMPALALIAVVVMVAQKALRGGG